MISLDMLNSFSSSILIVDDNPKNVQILGKILQEKIYEMEFATSGQAALDWLNVKQFDLILLDINMPGMDGFEVCRKIRSNPALNNVPVIFISSDSDRESILKGFELGAQDYITKPFDGRELLVRVRTHLVLKESLEKLETLNRSLEEKVTDRTQQLKETNEKLEALNLKLIDLDMAKAEFLSLISHEIRTPLNGIIGPLELLKEPVSASEFNVLVEILDTSVKRLEKFALNAILITRLKTRQLEIIKDRIHIPKLINEVIENEKGRLQRGNIQVKRNNELTRGLIHGEPELIKQCIDIIIENAIISSPQNGTIEINTFDQDQSMKCEIKDNGPGFAKGVIEHVFDLFRTGNPRKDNCKGTGLSIAKMIIEAHGGSINIVNNPEGGASVTLLFRNNIED